MRDMTTGDRVTVHLPNDHPLFSTRWWPQVKDATATVTGTVQTVFKNGQVAVAIDQLPNYSADGKRTLHIASTHLLAINPKDKP